MVSINPLVQLQNILSTKEHTNLEKWMIYREGINTSDLNILKLLLLQMFYFLH